MVGRQEDKLRRLYLDWVDKYNMAQTMRSNLASDIIAGYHLNNVVKQMVEIENYEQKVVGVARKVYEAYRNSVASSDYHKYELKFRDELKLASLLWGGNK